MRRIASVFSSKRDKSESAGLIRRQNTQPQPSTVESPTTSIISTPQLSSGASSNGSTSLQTPEPDERPKRSWKSWLGKGKTDTIKMKKQPEWPSLPPPLLKQPPAANRKGPRADETEDEEETDSDEDSDLGPTRQSRQTLQILIKNSLWHRVSASPFIQLPDVPAYPHSCSLFHTTARQESLESSMHKRRLLYRLLDTKRPLTRAEEVSILPFSSSAKRVPTLVRSNSPPLVNDEPAPPKLSQITQFSRGLHSWISRPCFEERYSVYIPTEAGIVRQRVTGTRLGVAALEYSEALEAMIDFSFELPARKQHLDESAEEPETPSPSSSSSSLPHSRTPPYSTVPSPLRNEHSPAIPPIQTDTDKEPQSQPTVKRGVRFAEDDKEDTIPIGYVLRIKKQREQKAKFLREEKERRAFEEERRRTDAERREREKVRREWERERQAWEQERKAVEEEKQKRLYQAEVLGARERREAQRMGVGLRSMSSSSSFSERNTAEAKRYSRPAYDGSHRQASEPAVASTSSSSPHSSSPSSSRPSSVVGQGATSLAPPQPTHRPSSIHSNHSLSSSEDVRSRESSRKRNSMASISSNRFTSDLTLPYAMRSSSSTSLHSYPIPPVPAFPLDMPLLPPTAPFMLHQYPRPKTNPNSNPSLSPSRRTPSNHSSERINVPNHEASTSPRQLSPSSPHRPPHQRRASGDNTRRDRQRSSHSSHATPPVSISRGRQPQDLSSYSQTIVSPWTAPPSQYGQYGMSPSNNSNNLTVRMPPRRQTTMI